MLQGKENTIHSTPRKTGTVVYEEQKFLSSPLQGIRLSPEACDLIILVLGYH